MLTSPYSKLSLLLSVSLKRNFTTFAQKFYRQQPELWPPRAGPRRSLYPGSLCDRTRPLHVVTRLCHDEKTQVDAKMRTLEREVRRASRLIIWTDCDREGENIGFEIIDVCKAVKPDLFVLSYGSCQFPTLGFVVERYKAIQEFIPQQFWKIKVRLFDHLACLVLFEKCQENPLARVTKITTKNKTKWRPLPLDTVEMEKLVSRKLRINAKETMKIAEKLYTQGYISYPRTETNIFPKELDLRPLVQMQTDDVNWGGFAGRVLEEGPNPRHGKKSDQAHPPIHPTKYVSTLQGNEQKIYEFIVRHFLACVSKDARGTETIVEIDIEGELFSANGLIILERNYLEVYHYDRWSDKVMPRYEEGQEFTPTSVDMTDGETSPPALLTEADLIALMEKHGIGTDATHADHIETIKSRSYVGLQDMRFVPGQLGMGLVEGSCLVICKQTYHWSLQAKKIDTALSKFLDEEPHQRPDDVPIPDIPQFTPVSKCALCGCDMVVKQKRDGGGQLAPNRPAGAPSNRDNFPNTNTNQQTIISFQRRGNANNNASTGINVNNTNAANNAGGSNNEGGQTFGRSADTSGRGRGSQGRGRGREGYGATNNDSATNGMGSFSTTVGSSPPTNLSWNGNRQEDRDNAIMCNCNEEALLLTVRKEGPNTVIGLCLSSHVVGSTSATSSKADVTSSCGRTQTKMITVVMVEGEVELVVEEVVEVEEEVAEDGKVVEEVAEDGKVEVEEEGGKEVVVEDGKVEVEEVVVEEEVEVEDGGEVVEVAAVTCPLQEGVELRHLDGMEHPLQVLTEVVSRPRRVWFSAIVPYLPRSKLVVKKESPNKGREFYICTKGQSEQCRFFKWADELPEGDSGFGNSRGGKRGGARGGKKRAAQGGEQPKKRKCGVCGEVGHNRKNCPQNDY
ncbi:DNA topoisomerase 3-alpha-like [Homarus americanus]|uniref:DNA topoisomerase n=1 Tax=Homarus americanus TaxID=6706 RepID=A0A8J5JGE2_HOMAM|nr:DNA topoisomerase 3-alpha-like [Homarus americanus]